MEINGKKVVDATRKMNIKISARDIADGNNKDPGGCAAARAVKRIPNCISARVHIGRVYVEEPKRWVRYFTPEALRTEIVAFDRGGSFEPGEYTLNTPSKCESEEGRKKYRASNRSGAVDPKRSTKLKNPRKVHVVSGVRPKGANR